MNSIRYEQDAQGIVTLTFDAPGAPVNTMTPQWQADLTSCVERLYAEKDGVRGVILASAKDTFFAGADLKAVLELKPDAGAAVFADIEITKKQFRRLEQLGRPVVAMLAGTALGGGWELALAAHQRIAVDSPKIQFGLPEVTLGLLPGASGVTKTVRLLGLLESMPYLVEGKTLRPAEAHKLGLVGELVASADQLRAAAIKWIEANPNAVQPWDVKGHKIPGGTPSSPKVAQALAIGPSMLRQKTRGLYPAPEAILACMVEGAQVDFDTALRIESRWLATLVASPVTHALIGVFFDRNLVKSGASRPKDVPKWKASKVGILGAGMMGAGIAYSNAMRGVACVLKDVSIERAEQGKSYTKKLSDKRVARGIMAADKQAATLALITPTAAASDLRGCDLIIEAVFEQRALKATVTQEAEPMLAPGGFFASNTSTLPITGLATASARPDKFIGLHFFSPVDKMELVEIIKGRQTDAETLARAYDYVLQIGKTPIVVNDSRGFYTSRTFGTFVMEGCAMLEEGIPATVIENAALAAGMPVGPLAVLDETSLSLSVHVMAQTAADLAAEGKRFDKRPGEALVEMMVKEFKRPGRAAGGGFYDYPEGEKKRLWPGLKERFEKPGVAWDIAELRDRILYRQAVETLRCLADGVLESGHDANIGSIFGIGFPAWTGGAWRFIEAQGLDAFCARARELAAAHGERFTPPVLPAGWAPGQKVG
ncbi:3-hydroxyacyl-CoA dehydrogenase NAD-binding domain-containing protein [Rivibacter subsaxonicus]|uniref:Short chain enoyl-CoA hydratase /3-hydroxyacyl-CoA dehydrogenase n=1 Tax=Rivibacter subsaxonicus TaxID=457575 RepID=A0A4Q7V5Y0_9BURK|nr:3-hydroxyacyl-CoA dehydrogenase NAD-binding domain-containing protein [Rivibacter subsaxonicus]RZT91971.1 short chain enoyl-CoA hydratase /3-hydroxyacyl-CoA dehydrogenase [Rivibacter subsaxonicus]